MPEKQFVFLGALTSSFNIMKIYSDFILKFEQANWSKNPEFGLIDTILEQNPDILLLIKSDVLGDSKNNHLGRGDVPSLEQIMRAAIYKELKGYDYRELAYAQEDSRICEMFVKLDRRHPYSFQMYQKYISRIRAESLQKLLLRLNEIAIGEGLEDIKKIRQDSTVVETNIHYPTNNSLIWDCIERFINYYQNWSRNCQHLAIETILNQPKGLILR